MARGLDDRHPRPPAGSGPAGRKLWTAVLTDFTLDAHEVLLLREACRTADNLDELAAIVEKEGLTIDSSAGPRVHPAAVQDRQPASPWPG